MLFQIILYKSDYFGSSTKYCESCTKLVTLDCVTIDLLSRVILYKLCYFEPVQMLWYLETSCTKVVVWTSPSVVISWVILCKSCCLNQSKCCDILSHLVQKLLFWTSQNVMTAWVILYKSCYFMISWVILYKSCYFEPVQMVISWVILYKSCCFELIQMVWYLESTCTKLVILKQPKYSDSLSHFVILKQFKCYGISSHPVQTLLFWTSPNVVISWVILYKSCSLNQSKCCDILSRVIQNWLYWTVRQQMISQVILYKTLYLTVRL